jgi:hypothetical protein
MCGAAASYQKDPIRVLLGISIFCWWWYEDASPGSFTGCVLSQGFVEN